MNGSLIILFELALWFDFFIFLMSPVTKSLSGCWKRQKYQGRIQLLRFNNVFYWNPLLMLYYYSVDDCLFCELEWFKKFLNTEKPEAEQTDKKLLPAYFFLPKYFLFSPHVRSIKTCSLFEKDILVNRSLYITNSEKTNKKRILVS
jgi:hypothetical protein